MGGVGRLSRGFRMFLLFTAGDEGGGGVGEACLVVFVGLSFSQTDNPTKLTFCSEGTFTHLLESECAKITCPAFASPSPSRALQSSRLTSPVFCVSTIPLFCPLSHCVLTVNVSPLSPALFMKC